MERALFLDILDNAVMLEASDKRDKVYAFLGSPWAQNENGRPLVEPDYGKTVDQVYLDVTIALLNNPREAVWVLQYIRHTSTIAVQGEAYPSWALRWDDSAMAFIYPIYPNGTLAWYRAGGEETLFHTRILNEKHLVARGFCFDRLAWTSPQFRDSNFYFDTANWDTEFRVAGKPFSCC